MPSGPFSIESSGRDADSIEAEKDLPPVVARMVVEIRSDGTRTMARGAMEDLQTGHKVALKADASTPIALAKELARALLITPPLAKDTLRSLVPDGVRSLVPEGLLKRALTAAENRKKRRG